MVEIAVFLRSSTLHFRIRLTHVLKFLTGARQALGSKARARAANGLLSPSDMHTKIPSLADSAPTRSIPRPGVIFFQNVWTLDER